MQFFFLHSSIRKKLVLIKLKLIISYPLERVSVRIIMQDGAPYLSEIPNDKYIWMNLVFDTFASL